MSHSFSESNGTGNVKTLSLPIILATFLSFTAGCSTHTGTPVAGIKNFGPELLNSKLYRGAQPTDIGFTTLSKMGVRTVVNLRDDAKPREQAAVEAHGMRYVSLGLSANDAGKPSAERKLRSFLAIMDDPANQPVFVHCREGKDRTGLFVAVYRMVDESASREAAVRELAQYGHDRVPIKLFKGIDAYLATFDPATFASSRHPAELPNAAMSDDANHGD